MIRNTAYSSVNKERPCIGTLGWNMIHNKTCASMSASSHILVELPSRVYNLRQSPYLVAFWRSKGYVSMAPPTRLTGGAIQKKKQNHLTWRCPIPRGPSETSWGMTVTLLVFQIPMMLHDKSCLSCLWFIEIFIVVDWNHCHPLCLVTFNLGLS